VPLVVKEEVMLQIAENSRAY
jgi:hypothetical protein